MQNLNEADWNIGYTTRSHLCLDLDNTSLMKVYGLVELLMQNYHEIGNALILESSSGKLSEKWNYKPKFDGKSVEVSGKSVMQADLCIFTMHLEKRIKRSNYHVIFNDTIPYSKSCDIIECLAELDVLNHEYVNIRRMRNDMTIRISKTINTLSVKSKPRILDVVVNPYTMQKSGGIYKFLCLYKAQYTTDKTAITAIKVLHTDDTQVMIR